MAWRLCCARLHADHIYLHPHARPSPTSHAHFVHRSMPFAFPISIAVRPSSASRSYGSVRAPEIDRAFGLSGSRRSTTAQATLPGPVAVRSTAKRARWPGSSNLKHTRVYPRCHGVGLGSVCLIVSHSTIGLSAARLAHQRPISLQFVPRRRVIYLRQSRGKSSSCEHADRSRLCQYAHLVTDRLNPTAQSNKCRPKSIDLGVSVSWPWGGTVHRSTACDQPEAGHVVEMQTPPCRLNHIGNCACRRHSPCGTRFSGASIRPRYSACQGRPGSGRIGG